MLKSTATALALAVTLSLSSDAGAHSGGHGELIEKYEALVIATNVASFLVTNNVGQTFGLLPPSWSGLNTQAAEIHQAGPGYMIVKVTNSEEKTELFILMSDKGRVYDANFTGAFEGLGKLAPADDEKAEPTVD